MVQQKLVSSEKTNEKEKICREELKPQLRFSEFTDNWKESNLGNLFNFSVAGDMDKELFSEIKDEEFKYPLYANALEKEGLLGYYKESKYIANSITITARGNIGHSIVRKSDFNAIGRLIILNSKKELNNDFFSEYINSNLKFYIESTGVPQLTAPSLKINKVKYPNLDEQNKISNFILAINKKIELLEKKKEISNQTKSSILKSIFDNVSIYSEDVKINNLFSIKKGKGLSKEKIDVNGKYAAILYGELYTKYSEIIESPISFTDYDEGVPSKKGDILIPGSTTTKGIDLVTASVVCEDNIQLGGDINILRKKKELNPIYAATFIKYFMKREILRLTQGSTIIHLYGKDLKDLEIMLPSLKIQNNVANFIKHYNTKENLYNEEINKVKRFKKALLQKMFV